MLKLHRFFFAPVNSVSFFKKQFSQTPKKLTAVGGRVGDNLLHLKASFAQAHHTERENYRMMVSVRGSI